MRVVVDHERCEGNRRCEHAAPDIFEVRDDDLSHVLLAEIPASLHENAERAARLCPRQAVLVER